MITKILFTLAIVGLGYLYFLRSRRQQLIRSAQPKAAASVSQANDEPKSGSLRLAAYGLIVFMILASGVFLYLEWRDQYRIVDLRVINTHTGESVSYQARRGDVDDRVFETLDGRVVRLADIERLEMGKGNGR